MQKYIQKECKHHGITNFKLVTIGRDVDGKFAKRVLKCVKCVGRLQVEYVKRIKKNCVQYKGGKCERCGYNKCLGALEFHHKNPEEKEFSLSNKKKRFEILKIELDKCLLVCANCHREIHEELVNVKENS